MNKLNKSKSMGVVIFAFNNEGINYLRLALYCAERVLQYWKLPVTIVTDTPFSHDQVDCIHANTALGSQRTYQGYTTPFSFLNGNRHEVFRVTPYDKTIVIDSDFLVSTSQVPDLWDGRDLRISKSAVMLDNSMMPFETEQLGLEGLPMYWATIVCFDKGKVSEKFFSYWLKAKRWYRAYSAYYGFSPTLFRNDYCVTIAMDLLTQKLGSDTQFQLPYTIPTASFNMEILGVDPMRFKVDSDVLEYQKTDVHVLLKKPLFPLLDSLGKDYKCELLPIALEA